MSQTPPLPAGSATSAPAVFTQALPSYLDPKHLGPWGVYLQQVDRVTPYLGPLARWVDTLKRPKRTLIVDVLETQRQLKKDSKGANFLITCCSKAQAALTAAVGDLKAETKTQGVEKQLQLIEEQVAKIRTFIGKNA